MEAYDVIIVGGGPAGLSAALVLGRCCRKVLLCDAGNPRNAASIAVHGFLTRDGTHPAELLKIARSQLSAYDVRLREGTVMKVRRQRGTFVVTMLSGEQFTAGKILLATGVVDVVPEMHGIKELYGKSVHHCPYCDAWEHKGEPMAALGKGHAAAMLAIALQAWSPDIVLASNGAAGIRSNDKKLLSSRGIEVREETIQRLEGERGRLQRIIFKDGSSLARRAIFFSTSNVQRSKLAASLGCVYDSKGAIRASTRCETDSPGVYIAGDASDDAQFVIVAAAEGAKAAIAINKALIRDALNHERH
jgi:thioredoxin reductase